MLQIKRLIVMYSLNVSSAVAESVLNTMDRAGITEESATLREFIVAAGAAYAEHRDSIADEHREAG